MKANILIKRYLSHGDLSAVRDLLSFYEKGLFRYLWQMLKHHQDSEDALQETFRKAIEALPVYREENHFKSWLYRIGHNTALEVIRKRKKNFEIQQNANHLLDISSIGPRDFIIECERAKGLFEAISALPERERIIVSLRLHEDLSFKEISEVVQAPMGTVLARMHKAKERLRNQLSGTYHE